MEISPPALPRTSVDEYLLAHEHSKETRHEPVDGYLYVRGGASVTSGSP